MEVGHFRSGQSDDSVGTVVGIDPLTGNSYVRLRNHCEDGREVWREWIHPDGRILCRFEVGPDGSVKITAGSLDAVQSYNMAYLPQDNREQIESLILED